ncbi:MAG: hypothetical protein COS88_00935 [Chloroflexi bacterium CG07_land_8_20_14_0_80_51_10]|nr:MAG: hypothetical protein COS88_00935 [Chloroflexi bacterium CG07_land_8_20_14_0_80_51_10]
MDEKTVSQMRADVIERFINLETRMNAIISQHYFGKFYKPFFLEVLYDEHFTFGLRRGILEKTVPDIDGDRK